jgi:hypothetical protein
MSTVAIKISAELAAATRIAAKAADRSLTGQIEHWAKIGRAAELQLSTGAVQALKQTAHTAPSAATERNWEQLTAALESVHRGEQFTATRHYLQQQDQPLYEADPSDPEGIVQVQPDGSRRRGSMVNRQFQPLGASTN